MQTLESLRRRIENTKDMQSVVKTMKALAAVHIREYEAAVESLRDYSRTLRLAFRILFRESRLPARHSAADGKFGAIVFGSDQGMCGQFNDEIASYALDYMREATGGPADWSVAAIGGRVSVRLEDAGLRVDGTAELPTALPGITPLVQDLLPRIEHWEVERGIGRVTVFYNQRVSASSFRPQHLRLLPLDLHAIVHHEEEDQPFRTLPMFTMERERLFSWLVRQYLFVAIYRACAESLASENASRIASMQTADKNIEERLNEFQSEFNRMRQSSITEELLDVVGGFEALTAPDDG